MSLQTLNPEQAQALLQRCQKDPVFHLEQVQGIKTLEGYQRRTIQTIWENDRTAISACHDVGKTWMLSRAVLAYGSSFPGAKIITTAPTFTLVEKLLWSEIRTGHRQSKYPLGGKMLTTEWKINSEWFAIGLSPKEDASEGEGQGKSSSFQGFHGDHILVVFDEATGVPAKRWIQAEGMMTSASVKFVAIGNPTSKNSDFYRCFNSAGWKKVYLSCFDSPNLIVNGVTDMETLRTEVTRMRELTEEQQLRELKLYKVVQPRLLTLTWVITAALIWGMDHPLFVSKVLGTFPENDDNVLIPLGVVEEAQRRRAGTVEMDRSCFGVDVARFGSDKTVITEIKGRQVMPAIRLIQKATTEVVGKLVQILNACKNPDTIDIDATGVGSGVVDGLIEAKRAGRVPSQVRIQEIHFGSGCDTDTDRDRFANLKAKMFVDLARDLKSDLCLPVDVTYPEQLPTIIFSLDSKGRTVIESKDDYKKRTGKSSPDEADALALANLARVSRQSAPEIRIRRL